MEKIVIIGGVAAGPKAACRVKRLLPDAQVTIIDQDTIISYGRSGIPYFIGGEINDEKALRSTNFHTVRDETFFREAKGVEVETGTKAVAINRKAKVVRVERLDSGGREDIPYDKLVLATGSRPNILPIAGSGLTGVFNMGSLKSAMNLQKFLVSAKPDKAVVIGGGAMGLEMAEALQDMWGLETSVVEFMPQLLPNVVEWPLAKMLEKHLKDNEVEVYTSEAASEIRGDDQGRVEKVITSKQELDADLVIMSVGVRPRDELARETGLLVSPKGGIVVNNRLQTSDPDIFAVGDCIETNSLVTGGKTYAPLGSLANRQGRVVGDNLGGLHSVFEGVAGSFIMKAFDSCIGATGVNLETARKQGFEADMSIAIQSDRAHFMSDQQVMALSVIFDKKSRRVLGVQAFGAMGDAVLARINAAAGLIAQKASIEDFSNLEMAYAPPFSTAVDIINAAANVADNLAGGRLRSMSIENFLAWMDNPAARPEYMVLDVRHTPESEPLTTKFKDIWMSIPYEEIRSRYQELPKDKKLIIICGAGMRSYEVQLFLDSAGFEGSIVLGGGAMILARLGLDWMPK